MNELRVSPSFSSEPTTASEKRLEFTGPRSDFVRLVLRGAALELITAGFYRFWLATDMRRHLWSATSLDGDAPEYVGTPKELLLGFLFAMAILLPLYAAYFLIGIEAQRWKAFASIPLVLFYYLFAQFARYRARRYRVTRTVWRGLRFGMGGSGLVYVGWFSLWTLGSLLTLGLLMPWRQAALERYKMGHTAYGTLPGHFAGTGWALFKQVWWLWLLWLASLMAMIAMARWPKAWFLQPLVPFTWPFLYAAYKASEWRWWLSGIRFGEVAIESDLERSELIGRYWLVIGWFVLLLGCLLAWLMVVSTIWAANAGLAGAPVLLQVRSAMQQLPVMILVGGGYVVAALAFGALMRIYLTRDLWERLAESATIRNLAAMDDVAAQGRMAGAVGEGLSGDIDIAGF
jgi:uncharacterized membrane protein YjgN (DUF898 family)